MLDHGHFEHCDDRASPERHRRLQPWRPTPSVLNAPFLPTSPRELQVT